MAICELFVKELRTVDQKDGRHSFLLSRHELVCLKISVPLLYYKKFTLHCDYPSPVTVIRTYCFLYLGRIDCPVLMLSTACVQRCEPICGSCSGWCKLRNSIHVLFFVFYVILGSASYVFYFVYRVEDSFYVVFLQNVAYPVRCAFYVRRCHYFWSSMLSSSEFCCCIVLCRVFIV